MVLGPIVILSMALTSKSLLPIGHGEMIEEVSEWLDSVVLCTVPTPRHQIFSPLFPLSARKFDLQFVNYWP